MSLILGINLLRKLYLISDTRVTYSVNGNEIHEDNQLKFTAINPRNSVVVAGNGHQSAFFVKKIKENVSLQGYLSDIKDYLDKNHKQIEKEYLEKYHNPGLSVFIIAGYNNSSGKMVESSLLGNAMSGDLVARGNGSFSNQSVDHEIIQALTNGLAKKGTLNKGDFIEVNVPNSGMLAIEIDTGKHTFTLSEVDCYKYAIYHPNYWEKSVPVPDKLLSFLDFRNIGGKSTEDVLYEDAEVLYNFVSRTAREQNFDSVGGHVFVTLQSDNSGVLFPTGDLATIKDNQLVYAGTIEVIDSKISYVLPNGKKGEYQTIESLINKDCKVKI